MKVAWIPLDLYDSIQKGVLEVLKSTQKEELNSSARIKK